MVERNRQPALFRLLIVGWAAAAGLSAQTFAAQSDMGRPDPSFNSSGKTSTDLGGLDRAQAVAVQGDGKIVIAGSTVDPDDDSQWALTRYLPDGRLDTTFGEGGILRTDFEGISSDPDNEAAYGIALDGDAVLVAGTALGQDDDLGDFALARYSKNAQGGWGIDEGFGEGGKVTADLGNRLVGDRGLAIAVKANHEIVVGGQGGRPTNDAQPADYDPCLALFEADGDFLKAGCPNVGYQAGGEAIAVQDDGKVVVAGWMLETGAKLLLARYSLDRESGPILDGSFGETQTPSVRKGYVKATVGERAFAVAVREGKITIAGQGPKNLVLQRYDERGVLDGSFGPDATPGTLTVELPGFEPSRETTGMGMHVEPDGKIILSSGRCDPCPEGGAPIVRIKADGKGLDHEFGQGGVASAGFPETTALVDLAPDPKGKVVAAGWMHVDPEILEVVDGSSQPKDDFAVARFVSKPRALVAGLEPKQGPVAGGGRITIRGSRLAAATSVLFGQSRVTAHPCTASGSIPCFSVVSESEITAQVPPGSTTGPVHVVVDTPEGRSIETNDDLYNYLPVVRDVAPREGPKAGRTLVKLTGAGLDNTRKVMFGGKAIDSSCLLPNVLLSNPCFTIQSPHQVNVFSPSSDKAGKVHVRVDVGTGLSEETEADIFTYLDDELLPAPAPPPAPGKAGGGGQIDSSGPPVSGTSVQPGSARPPIPGLGAPPGGPSGLAPELTGAATTSPHLGPASALGVLPGPLQPAGATQGILQAPASAGPVVPLPAFSDDPAVHPAPRYGMSGMPALALSTMLVSACFAILAAGRFPGSRPVRASAAPAR